MAPTLIDTVVPRQRKGNQTSTRVSKNYWHRSSVLSRYEKAVSRMLDVNCWHIYAGAGSATFQLVDFAGNKVYRRAQEGDYFQIDIPGPSNRTGEGNDWVLIEKIGSGYNADEVIMYMRVTPAAPPFASGNETAHFFSNDASSTFLIHRLHLKITAAVYGRNEIPNISSGKPMDKLRNLVVALVAFIGFSYSQWKSLARGWLAGPGK